MVDNIIVIVDGEISEVGSYEELLSHDKAFAQFLRTYLQQEDSEDDEDEECLYFCLMYTVSQNKRWCGISATTFSNPN